MLLDDICLLRFIVGSSFLDGFKCFLVLLLVVQEILDRGKELLAKPFDAAKLT